MELSAQEQIKKIISESKEILLISDAKRGADSVASILSFQLALAKLNKKATAVAQISSASPELKFLPGFATIQQDLRGAKDFIISLDISHTKVEQFKYKIKDKKLNIYITPSGGYFEPHDVETKKGKSKFDLIIVLNTPALESLDELYKKNAEIFYESPLINIDCHSSNENFGEINLVEITASSTSEILFQLLRALEEKIIDENIATNLLAGIISQTNNFQAASTNPKTFMAAAKLVALGAKRAAIIQNLYKKRTLANLHLWGRALARLKSGLNEKVIWTVLSRLDFEKSHSTLTDTGRILGDLKNNTLRADIIFLLAEEKTKLIQVKLQRVNKNLDLGALKSALLTKNFQEIKTQDDLLTLSVPTDLLAAEKIVLDETKRILTPA